MPSQPPPLGATYRLQLHKDFGFEDAREIAPYLARLGVTHLYSSPILKSRPGSTHGYDVADPTVANPELGGEDGRQALVGAVRDAGLGLLLDIVPNHMGTGSANPFWEDVLTHGVASRYAKWFDIRWTQTAEPLKGHVLLPILGDKLPKVIERGEITITLVDGRLRLKYFDNEFPVAPATYPAVLERALSARGGKGPQPRPAQLEKLREISARLWALGGRRQEAVSRQQGRQPLSTPSLPASSLQPAESRAPSAEAALGDLAELLKHSPALRRRVESAAEGFGRGAQGKARVRELVLAQPYRLAFWRKAARLINYRRFFDINELIALRMEDEAVFTGVHARVLEWVAAGEVHGLRVDHIDGLLDPLGYLARLRAEVESRQDGNARAKDADRDSGFPLVVEKILTPGEHLRTEWPVQGTTGYEFLNDLESVFVDAEGTKRITEFYKSLRPGTRRDPLDDFEEVSIRGKLRILGGALAPDVRGLAGLLLPIAKRDGRVRALGVARLAKYLTEWLACFPVYRTYIDARGGARPDDRDVIERVAKRCGERGRVPPHVVAFLRDVMLDPGEGEDGERRLRFVAKLQQTSGPATAKGVEDTALYQYVPLVSLNEVGGEPVRPLERSVERFHEANAERARDWPRNLLCTNTHDTKRSADVRARIDALAEMPEAWTEAVTRWRRMNATHRQGRGARAVPDANSEYLFYQTLLGVWPVDPARRDAVPDAKTIKSLRERVEEYMLKAVKEAKLHTSWTEPNEEYESALKGWIAAVLPDRGASKSEFLRDLASFASEIARLGLWTSLARVALHLTAPGVPDVYRGDELWNFTLVDPDNRRPVDFARRDTLLAEIAERWETGDESRARLVRELVATPEDDRTKLLLTWRALQLRRSRGDLFLRGEYEPLHATGAQAAYVVAFARRLGDEAVLVIAPRLTAALGGGEGASLGVEAWGDTTLVVPVELVGDWRSTVTGDTVQCVRSANGGTISIGNALATFPVAILERNTSRAS